MKGTFLPGCCQKHSCGSCPATKQRSNATSKSNYELAKGAMLFDVRTSEVSMHKIGSVCSCNLYSLIIIIIIIIIIISCRVCQGFLGSCQKNCKRDCLKRIPFMTMIKYRKAFWGKTPNGNERWKKYCTAINAARNLYVERILNGSAVAADYTTPMIFMADDQEVCEQAYCSMLGIVTTQGYRMKAWKDAVSFCCGDGGKLN